jgi:hypothetical protein
MFTTCKERLETESRTVYFGGKSFFFLTDRRAVPLELYGTMPIIEGIRYDHIQLALHAVNIVADMSLDQLLARAETNSNL